MKPSTIQSWSLISFYMSLIVKQKCWLLTLSPVGFLIAVETKRTSRKYNGDKASDGQTI